MKVNQTLQSFYISFMFYLGLCSLSSGCMASSESQRSLNMIGLNDACPITQPQFAGGYAALEGGNGCGDELEPEQRTEPPGNCLNSAFGSFLEEAEIEQVVGRGEMPVVCAWQPATANRFIAVVRENRVLA